jgi:hypothetical protein
MVSADRVIYCLFDKGGKDEQGSRLGAGIECLYSLGSLFPDWSLDIARNLKAYVRAFFTFFAVSIGNGFR